MTRPSRNHSLIRSAKVGLVVGVTLVVCLAFGAGAVFAAPATVTLNPPPEASYTTVQLSGTVDPGGEEAVYGFEYSIDPNEEGWATAPGAFESLISTPTPVSTEVTGLKPSTTYLVRLVALNASGEAISAEPNPTITTKTVDPPTATLDPITVFTGSTAHFSGTVASNAPAGPLSPAGEVAFETAWHFVCSPDCPGLSGVVPAGTSAQPISVDADRLEANTVYEVKLVATSAGGTSSPERTFKTSLVSPSVKSAAGASDGKGGFILQGVVNPFGSQVTNCEFEYGPTSNYVFEAPCSPLPAGRNEKQLVSIINATEGNFKLTFRGQTTANLPFNASAAEVQSALLALSTIGPSGVTVSGESQGYTIIFGGALAETNVGLLQSAPGSPPLGNENVGGGGGSGVGISNQVEGGNNLPVVVEAHVTGLTPDATYHFHLVATTGAGTIATPDRIFIPTLDPSPPPCPNEAVRTENSSGALPECRAYEQVSSSEKAGYPAILGGFSGGSSVFYASNAGNILNSGQGYPGTNDYVADRTATGWKTIPNLNGTGGSLFSGPEALFGPRHPEIYAEDLQSSIWYTQPGAVTNSDRRPYLRESSGHFTRIGNSIPGSGANYQENIVGSSADLSHVVFDGQFPPYAPIFGPGVYEFVGTGNDLPTRVDVDNSGDPISTCGPVDFTGGGGFGDAVSKDGSVVVFTAIGGCGPGNPAANEVWARVDGTTSYDASLSHCTRTAGDPGGACNAASPATFENASPDGSSIFFSTTQQLVNGDTDQTNDLYVYDLPTASHPSPSLTEVSGAASKAGVEEFAASSDDGSTAYFVASGVLADNEDALEEKATAGDHNLYVWRRDAANPDGLTTFVTRLNVADIVERFAGRVISHPQVTPDGHYVVLGTVNPIIATDSDNSRDVYRYDAENGVLVRVSTNTSGVGGNADGFDAIAYPGAGEIQRRHSHPAISDDGEDIVFTSSEALSPLDGNEAPDVYFWKSGRVRPLTSGAVGGGGQNASIDGSGQDIYFETPEALSPTDGDTGLDVYDARVGGGFSDADASSCAGEECQPPGPGSPPAVNPATGSPPAPETKPKTCAKGKVLRKGRCVKKKAKKQHEPHKKGKRAAGANHGGSK